MQLSTISLNALRFHSTLQGAIDRSTSPAHAFRELQTLTFRIADTLEDRTAATLLMTFAMLVRPKDALSVLETFSDLANDLPPSTFDCAAGAELVRT